MVVIIQQGSSWLTPNVIIACIALCVACAAFIVAFNNYRRSNYVVLRVLDTSGHYSSGVDGNYYIFSVTLLNLGIPIHDLKMCLVFHDKSGTSEFSRYSLGLLGKGNKECLVGQFAKGMITEFFIKSNFYPDARLPEVTDNMCVELELSAGDFEVWRYPFQRQSTWFKRKWNRLAYLVNSRFTKTITNKAGEQVVMPGSILPKFNIPVQSLMAFLKGYKRELEKSQSASKPPSTSSTSQV